MLQTSPLDAAHRTLGAKMGAFAGWDMPIEYEGTLAEHAHVRERAGVFDVSHLGKLLVRGPGAAAFLDRALTNRMADLPPGRARYTLILTEQAGIVDDLIVYGIAEDEYLLVPNAANVGAVEDALRAVGTGGDATIERPALTTIAVQGPASRAIVEERFPAAKGLGYMQVARDGDVVVARSGYTGELGYELFTSYEDARPVWDDILSAVAGAGGAPCGLAARDTLRLEMGYPLHGNDIGPDVRPDEAGLMWAVRLEGRSFPGARALTAATPPRSLVGLRMLDRRIPRAHCAVARDGAPIGEVTSGTFSPTLRVGIALALVQAGAVALGDRVEVDVRGKAGEAEVVRPPFVDRSPR